MNLSLLASPFVIPFVITGSLSFWMGLKTWREQNVKGWEWITLLLGASVVWSLAQTLEYISTELSSKILWDNLQWFGIAIIPPAFFLLSLDFVGHRKRIEIFSLLLLGIMPSLILILVYTNDVHHFFVGEYSLIRHGDFTGMDKQYRIGFWIFMIYSYTLFCSGLFHLIWMHIRSPNFYANQIRWISVAASITVVISALDTLNITPFPYFQPTVLAMSAFTLVVAGNLGKLRTMDVKRASGGRLLETISEPLFLFADNTILADLNIAAQNLISATQSDVVGKPLQEIAPNLFDQVSRLFQDPDDGESVTLELPNHSIPYYARMISIRDDAGHLHSRALALSSVFDHNQIAEELQRSNSFIKALGHVAARVVAVSSPAEVMKTMGEELNKLEIHSAFVMNDQREETSTLEYISFDSKIIRPVEKIIGQHLIGLKQHHSLWPSQSKKALAEKYPVFVSDFAEAVIDIFSDISGAVIKNGLQLAGISQQTKGIYIPLIFSDNTSGVIPVWGTSLSDRDLPAFSVFGSQVSSAFEQARLMDAEQRQYNELERSNALMRALNQVALRTASTYDPNDVLETLGDELVKLDLHCSLFKVDKSRSAAVILYLSVNRKITRQLEKMGGVSAIGFRMQRSEWSPLAVSAIETKESVFIPRFIEEIVPPFRKFGEIAIRRGLKLVGIDENISGYFVPLESNAGESIVLTIWGNSLREKDLPAFSVFANQVASAFENARLYTAERNQAEELSRSQDLIHSLSGVAARISSSSDPDIVMETLGTELKKFDMDCLVSLLDFDAREAFVRFHSMDLKYMKMAEKITGQDFTDQRLPLEKWPKTIVSVFENGQPVYVEKFLENTITFMPKIARSIARRALGYVGVDMKTSGYFLPLEVQGKVFGCLSIWGDVLTQGDLPAYSVFSSQVAGTFENARLYEAERKQARELEHSNELLYTLSQIVAGLSSTNSVDEILDTMRAELGKLGLDFTYTTTDLNRQTAVIEYISIESRFLDQIMKISGVPLVGTKFPKALWPENGLHAFADNRPQFRSDFVEAIRPLFQKFGKSILKQGLTLAGISETTPGLFLPLNLADGALGCLAIWGESLREEDVAAFEVFVRQVESRFENIRLYHQAEQEIAERQAAQEALFESKEEYRGLFENAHDAILIIDPTTFHVLNVNEQACEIYGFSPEEFVELRLDAISQDIDLFAKYIESNIEAGKHFNFETVQTRKDGTPMDLEINASVVYYQGIKAIQCINRDVTSRKRYEEKLSYVAFHDELTKLPNRALFLDRLAHIMERSSRNKSLSFAVLFLDLDRFKDVNDSLGHAAGDRFLIEVASRLESSIRGIDTVARLGGDEFVILLEEIKTIHEVTELCSRILDRLSYPILLDGNEIVVSGSIGVVASNLDYHKPEEYLRDADIAMYRAKDQGRSRFEIFDESMRIAVLERLELEANLRRAISNQEFVVVYQPIVGINMNQITGFEALIRWKFPDGRIVTPAEFIPIAEETGMINEIGYWVLLRACSQLKVWNQAYFHDSTLTMSVNVSGVQLMMAEFPDQVKKIIQETGIDPENLSLELTESSLIKDQKIAAEKLHSLKALGVRIHLDDFGTGYSSLSFLAQFNIDALKIDRQFVANISPGNQTDLAGVIIALGEKLNLKVIAEGIETEEQLAFLKETDCKYGQGYYFSKPVDAQTISKLLQENGEHLITHPSNFQV